MRLPIRLRLTLVFAFVLALVLAGVGAYVYVQVGASYDEALEETGPVRAEADEERAEVLAALLPQLLVGGVVTLVLVSLLAYLLAGAALRPVEELIARLEDGLRRERRFVADASHELRTPLASLQTELELALRRPRSSAELESALGSAAGEVERLVRLAEDLLVLAAAEDGRLRVQRSEFEVADLLEGVARRFAPRASAAGRALAVDAPREQTISADRLRLEQALGNLVDNALRHGDGTIRLGAAAHNGSLALRVTDAGAGFPPAFIERAFERFSRADAARTHGGAGLGLALVDAVARAHGGKAEAANTADGTVVSIVVPATSRVSPR